MTTLSGSGAFGFPCLRGKQALYPGNFMGKVQVFRVKLAGSYVAAAGMVR